MAGNGGGISFHGGKLRLPTGTARSATLFQVHSYPNLQDISLVLGLDFVRLLPTWLPLTAQESLPEVCFMRLRDPELAGCSHG